MPFVVYPVDLSLLEVGFRVILNDVPHQLVDLDTGIQHSCVDFGVVVFRFRAFGGASDENLIVRFSDFPKFTLCIVVRRYDAETVVDKGCAVVRNEP